MHIVLDTILVQIRTAQNKDLIKRITSEFLKRVATLLSLVALV